MYAYHYAYSYPATAVQQSQQQEDSGNGDSHVLEEYLQPAERESGTHAYRQGLPQHPPGAELESLLLRQAADEQVPIAIEQQQQQLGHATASSVGTPLFWLLFNVGIVAMLLVDLLILSRPAQLPVTYKSPAVANRSAVRRALVWWTVCVFCAAAFAIWLAYLEGTFGGASIAFVTGYVIEKSLSVDNLFVMLVTFKAFRVKRDRQQRVLFWGILGAVVLRALFVLAGAALVQTFRWVLDLFGVFLCVAAVKGLSSGASVDDDEGDGDQAERIAKFVRRWIPYANVEEDAFVVKQNGRYVATRLLLALVTIELADVVFALDSIPAIFAMTQDPFVVYTSNIFAVLGLRSLYTVLAELVNKFRFMHIGLALVLGFVGVKIAIARFVHVGTGISLGIIVGILMCTMLASSSETMQRMLLQLPRKLLGPSQGLVRLWPFPHQGRTTPTACKLDGDIV
mmetsp:Transcript_10057/g.36741  ORF Transcript_10057/g.36741 Transcript_10057/m.36741 type:complete len:454 (-) Transcript_10057:2458-3819(-)